MEISDLENRFKFHPAATQEKRDAHEGIYNRCLDLACILNNEIPESQEKSLAITKLEEVMFWSNAAIARHSTETKHQFKASEKDNDLCICGQPWDVSFHQ